MGGQRQPTYIERRAWWAKDAQRIGDEEQDDQNIEYGDIEAYTEQKENMVPRRAQDSGLVKQKKA